MHITTTSGPITLPDAQLDGVHLREGDLGIHFVLEGSLNGYESLHVERPGVDLGHNLDNPTEDYGTDWN